MRMRNFKKSSSLVHNAFEITKNNEGEDSLKATSYLLYEAHIYKKAGQKDEAIKLFDFIYNKSKKIFGEDHPQTKKAKSREF